MDFAHHRYTYSKPYSSERHNWELVCEKGGVNFHVSTSDSYGPVCGLEFHSITGQGAPNQLRCELTGGRCWHDGTSLYAQETLWPMIQSYLRCGDHESVFKILEKEAARNFKLNVEDEANA